MSVKSIFETLEYGPAPETTTPALDWIKVHAGGFGLCIDGAWSPAADGAAFEVMDPSTNKALAKVAQAGTADIDRAVAAARKAQPAWAALPGHARARHLYALARAVQKHSRLLAVLESLNNGKPIRESRDIDIPLVARHFYHHAGWAQLAEGEFPGYGPVGVVGQIIPWNFPLLMLAWKIAPALAAGNTVLLKPAEYTPLSALAFAELAVEAGLPPGVLNLVTGDGETGKLMVAHPGIDKIAFTGSTDVGRAIRVATAGTGKKLSLELGGKSPFLVFEDADLDSVVEGVVDAIWFNQGQVCCAGSRLLVQEGIETALLAKLRARMEKLRVGSPLDKCVDMGAIVAPEQLARIQGLMAQGMEEGGTIWQPSWAVPAEGCFYPPTLVSGIGPSALLAQVEIFGPVLVAMSFRTPAEAVALANNTPYGLAASVWTENINLALDIAPKVKAGVVWINCTNQFDASAGFGGYRESGFGREGGREGMWEYLKAHPAQAPRPEAATEPFAWEAPAEGELPPMDRTAKLFIGGKQARPDSGYSLPVKGAGGRTVGEVGEGNRKDLRNAVEAAHAAEGWGRSTGHLRAQILYYIAENLSARGDGFARRLQAMTSICAAAAKAEVEASISRLFTYGAWADKYDGAVHNVPIRGVALAMNEPIGVLGLACPEEFPLLGFVSLVAPAIAMGNTVVALPSQAHPLAATDFYSVLETSDLPGGVVNIVTGDKEALAKVLAEHDDVDGVWHFGSQAGALAVERAAAANMKRTWTEWTRRDWLGAAGEGREFLRHATEVKNIWIPYGE
ncbi:MAG: aldehyde dehydrogenase family protein [Holophagaceae bacterium]|nr:aldehyde dehydrogenase family protein [Holophagaceae bacterium]